MNEEQWEELKESLLVDLTKKVLSGSYKGAKKLALKIGAHGSDTINNLFVKREYRPRRRRESEYYDASGRPVSK